MSITHNPRYTAHNSFCAKLYRNWSSCSGEVESVKSLHLTYGYIDKTDTAQIIFKNNKITKSMVRIGNAMNLDLISNFHPLLPRRTVTVKLVKYEHRYSKILEFCECLESVAKFKTLNKFLPTFMVNIMNSVSMNLQIYQIDFVYYRVKITKFISVKKFF